MSAAILVDMNLSPDWVPLLINWDAGLGGNVTQVANDGGKQGNPLL
jgi:hypothetical protein